jgi:hypothetical protein
MCSPAYPTKRALLSVRRKLPLWVREIGKMLDVSPRFSGHHQDSLTLALPSPRAPAPAAGAAIHTLLPVRTSAAAIKHHRGRHGGRLHHAARTGCSMRASAAWQPGRSHAQVLRRERHRDFHHQRASVLPSGHCSVLGRGLPTETRPRRVSGGEWGSGRFVERGHLCRWRGLHAASFFKTFHPIFSYEQPISVFIVVLTSFSYHRQAHAAAHLAGAINH